MFVVEFYDCIEGHAQTAGRLPYTYETPALAQYMAERAAVGQLADGCVVVDVLAARAASAQAAATAYDVPRPYDEDRDCIVF